MDNETVQRKYEKMLALSYGDRYNLIKRLNSTLDKLNGISTPRTVKVNQRIEDYIKILRVAVFACDKSITDHRFQAEFLEKYGKK